MVHATARALKARQRISSGDTSPEALAEFFRTHPCRTPILCPGCGRQFKTRRGVDAHKCSRRFKTMQEFDRWYIPRGFRALGQPPHGKRGAR